MKILYVEDNEDNVYVLKRRLAREPISLVIATTGEEGVQLAITEMPDLILMDLDLPGIDGLEATRRLRAHSETSKIPIIALSAADNTEVRHDALAAGCDDCDLKPIDLAALRAKIDAILASR